MAVSLTLAVGMVPGKMAQAAEPTVFTTSADSNHWGRCDKRAYLNNGLATVSKDGTVSNKNYKLDSTADSDNTSGYAKHFSDPEFARVVPTRYMTNVKDDSGNVISVYEVRDRFWLPSGNYRSDQIISWGSEDISANTQYIKSTAADKARIIPISYWSYGLSSALFSWLRSSYYNFDYCALGADGGHGVRRNDVWNNYASAAACKINLNSDICGSVIFASAASVANFTAEGGAKKIKIAGSANFGEKSSNSLPDYGMYLKTASDKSFTATSLNLSGTSLMVNYTGGEAGQYVVVQAFKEDSLTAGTTGYAAAKQLEAGQTSATIDVTNWEISSLDGYTVKVWMEDGSGSLAKATLPKTFVGTSRTETGAVQNGRVFALKKDLQCSWGTLANATDLVGEDATNQKIIFGGMEFWIAGRETAVNGGAIDKDGDIMTLYQAKSVETSKFNASLNNYTVADKPAVTLQLAQDPISEIYDGTKKVYPPDQITTANLVDGYTLNWLYRTPGTEPWTEGMPTALGNYEVRCYTPGTENYERTYSNVVNFIIKKIPEPSDFVFTGPSSLEYDGKGKAITIEPKPGITGMGAVTVKYYKVNADGSETELEGPPIDVGKYRAKIHVDEGNAYNAAIIVIMF